MVPRPGRATGGSVAASIGLYGAASLHFGTPWGWRVRLLQLGAVGAAGALLLVGWTMPRGRRAAGSVAVLGLATFVLGVHGGHVGCNDLAYGPGADHGIDYEWESNRLRFGDHADSTGYRCRATPDRPAVLVGHLLAVGGTALAVRDGGRSAGP